MKLIDLDDDNIKEGVWRYGFNTRQDITDWLNRTPVIDAVPVVRCKDCHYGFYDSESHDAMICTRTRNGYWRHGDDFCSYGRQKDVD